MAKHDTAAYDAIKQGIEAFRMMVGAGLLSGKVGDEAQIIINALGAAGLGFKATGKGIGNPGQAADQQALKGGF